MRYDCVQNKTFSRNSIKESNFAYHIVGNTAWYFTRYFVNFFLFEISSNYFFIWNSFWIGRKQNQFMSHLHLWKLGELFTDSVGENPEWCNLTLTHMLCFDLKNKIFLFFVLSFSFLFGLSSFFFFLLSYFSILFLFFFFSFYIYIILIINY